MNPTIYIGIDPDIDKSGVAIYDKSKPKGSDLTLLKLSFFDLLHLLDLECTKQLPTGEHQKVSIVIEAGWLNYKSNYHYSRTKAIGERIAKNVGENHAVGKLIEQYCKRNRYTYLLKRPSKSTPKRSAQLFTKYTGYKERTNQEMRDAAMLVYGL
jgi:hypothetical protein